MYLQITTKCNMRCAHCCYSCGKNGKHMTRSIWEGAVFFAASLNNEIVAIGGGEPTLHPDFFDILQRCIWEFRYIWMATNGSRTKTMWRLAQIVDGEDYDEEGIRVEHEDQLVVALSNDYFHDPINEKVMAYWEKRSANRLGGFEMRDVTKSTNGAIAQGRAKKTGSGWATGCCCSDVMILTTGKIKLCGCQNAPIIGDIWSGIEDKWKEVIEGDKFGETCCYNGNKQGHN